MERFLFRTLVIIAVLVPFGPNGALAQLAGMDVAAQIYEHDKLVRRDCRQSFQQCSNSPEAKQLQNIYLAASASCKAEQEKMNCAQLTAQEPSLRSRIKKCDALSLCQDAGFSDNASKGCFWEAPKQYGKDIAEMFTASYQRYIACMKDEACAKTASETAWRTSPILVLLYSEQILANMLLQTSVEDVKSLPKRVLQASQAWIEKQNLKLQCFSREDQAAMLCYAALVVFAPGAAQKVATKVLPEAVRGLAALAGAQKKEEVVGEALARQRRGRSTNVVVSKYNLSPQQEKYIQDFSAKPSFANQADLPQGDLTTATLRRRNLKGANEAGSKELATAQNNHMFSLVASRMEAFHAKYPGIQVSADFKNLRFQFDPPPKNWPEGAMKDYQEALNGAKKEYGQYQHEHQLVRAGDRPENEFSAGFDESVDRADLAAKNASNYQNPSQVHSLQQPETLAQVKSMYDQADGFRQGLQKSLGNTSLMTSSGTAGRKILTEDVQLLARNAKSPEDLRKALKDVKKVEVSGQQAQDIMTYHHLVNEFAPDPLRVSQNISIVDAKYGAIALDVGGLGAKNTYATSKAMASTQNLDRGIVAARGGEQALTGRVLERFTTMEDDAKKYFGKYGVDVEVRKSGDEFQLVFLNKAPPAKAIKEFSASLASDGEFPLRGSHVPAGVTVSSDRALIAEQGHEIEKATKASLAGKIPPETLRKIVIVTTAEGKSAGTASTKFFLAEGDAALTTQQRAAVKEAMVKAVRDFNKTSSKTIPVSVPVIQSQEKEPTGIDPKN